MKQEPGKRIVMMADYLEHSSPEWRDPKEKFQVVSYGEYAAQVFKKTGLNMGGWGLGVIATLLGCLGLLLAFFGLLCLTGSQRNDEIFGSLQALPTLVFAGVVICFGVFFAYAARVTILKADDIQLNIPLTRANTADLPTVDSLVRPSQEPQQIQQSVLLRAAMETTEGREEELLRASTGGRE